MVPLPDYLIPKNMFPGGNKNDENASQSSQWAKQLNSQDESREEGTTDHIRFPDHQPLGVAAASQRILYHGTLYAYSYTKVHSGVSMCRKEDRAHGAKKSQKRPANDACFLRYVCM